MTLYTHWRDVPATAWRWANVSPAEIACRGTGKLLVNETALDKLQALRNRLGKLLIMRSTYSGPEHNRSVGIIALVAQAEREATSKRTKEALAVARSRGVRWATPMARRRSGGLARAVRRSGRPLRATPTGMRRTSRRWSRTSARAARPASGRSRAS